MNRAGKITMCFVSALALTAALRADDVVLPDNPYALIVARNIFGLNPPVPVTQTQAPEPPAKITPNGIMSIFGNLQVLFKVSGAAKPGQPPKDQFYTLSVGQRQDDIEVTHIDEKKSLITFNNHGVMQELPLANAPALTMPTPPGVNPAMPASLPNFNGGNGPGNRFGNRGGNFGGRNRNNGNGGGNNGDSSDNSNLRSVPTRTTFNAASQIPEGMTPEMQTLMIEANRLKAQQEGDPVAKILPITELTPEVNSDNGNQSSP